MSSRIARCSWMAFTVLALSSCDSEDAASEQAVRPIRAARVGDIQEIDRRSFPGRAQATQEVDLSFRVDGPLISLPVKIGDRVNQGSLLARVDPRDFEVRVRNADAQVERAKANLERADSEYQRMLGLRERNPGAVSELVLERSREGFVSGRADVAALEATVDAAQDAVNDTYLEAPYDGTIVANYVDNFQYVQARQPVLRLLDNIRIEFQFSVPETMISMVQYVTNIRVRFDAFPDLEIPAEVKEIGTEASQTTRTYPITLIMDQPEEAEILPGMAGRATGEARMPDDREQVDIVVPVTALFSTTSGEQSYVWVIDQEIETVSRREVQLGRLANTGVEILSGLEPGELIATAGVNFLQEGQQVRPTTE